MIAQFNSSIDPSFDLIEQLSAVAPENAMCTVVYARAHEALGARVCVFSLHPDKNLKGCIGFLRSGRLWSSLTIPSVPDLHEDDVEPFWNGIREFCKEHHVGDVYLGSYASRTSNIIPIGATIDRKDRLEFIVDLSSSKKSESISSNHVRNAKKAKKNNLIVRTSCDPTQVPSHIRLFSHSMNRREKRGEDVPDTLDQKRLQQYLRTGAGQLFQVYDRDVLLSSALLLRAPLGCYYQSGGTSPKGMSVGASHLLFIEVIELLQKEGLTELNLGGAEPENKGLQRFKKGFGARVRRLEAIECSLVPRPVRTVRRIWRHAQGHFKN